MSVLSACKVNCVFLAALEEGDAEKSVIWGAEIVHGVKDVEFTILGRDQDFFDVATDIWPKLGSMLVNFSV